MTKNKMLLHYEELGGIDIKATVNNNMVVQYFMTELGMTNFRARKLMADNKSPEGWPAAFDGDERFYRYMKEVMMPIAKAKVCPKEVFAVCWMQSGIYQEFLTTSRKVADSLFLSKERQDLPVVMFHREKAGKWQSNPIRRKNSRWIEYLYHCARELEAKEMQSCAESRGLANCKRCYMDAIPDRDHGCPIYTRRFKK